MKQATAIYLLMIFLGPPAVSAEERLPERLRRAFWTQGWEMKNVFVDVVRTPRESTVQILNEKESIALGVIVDERGWILTKASQISGAIECELFNKTRVPFEYVGYDVGLDLALLKISAEGLTAIVWETEIPRQGDWLVTTGTTSVPVGVGVMSVPRRKINRTETFGVLGIRLIDTSQAAIIEATFPNTGARKAGLERDDIVLKVNQTSIRGREHLIRTIRTFRPGDTVVIQVERDGNKKSYSITLTHPFGDFLSRIAIQQQLGGPLSFRRDDFEAVYQHDTVLKPEQCGGPVVNLDGRAVGINIARAGRTSSYLLPADLLLSRIEKLKSGDFPPPLADVDVPLDGETVETSGD